MKIDLDLLLGVMSKRTSRSYQVAFLFLVAAPALTVFLSMHVGISPINTFGHDTFLLLNGSWRMFQGQVPHVDFHMPLGFLYLVPGTLLMKMGMVSVDIVGLVPILLFSIVTLWMWLIVRGRFSAAIAAILSLSVGLTMIGRHLLGSPFTVVSQASIFNRYSCGFLCILLAECLSGLPKEKDSSDPINSPVDVSINTRNLSGDISTGVILAILFFSKLNYFGAGAIFVAGSWLFSARKKARACGVVLSFLSVGMICMACLDFNWRAVLYDYTTGFIAKKYSAEMIQAASFDIPPYLKFDPSIFDFMMIGDVSLSIAKTILVISYDGWIFACLGVAWLLYPEVAFLPTKGRLFVYLAVILVFSELIVLTNFQSGEQAIHLVIIASLVEFSLRSHTHLLEISSENRIRSAGIMALAFVILSTSNVKNILSMAYCYSWQQHHMQDLPDDFRFEQVEVENLSLLEYTKKCDVHSLATRIKDGIRLIQKMNGERKKLLVADFTNQFMFALQSPPTRGDQLWWDSHATIPPGRVPEIDEIFHDAQAVMIPKCIDTPRATYPFIEAYRGHIETHFKLAGESKGWKFYEKI